MIAKTKDPAVIAAGKLERAGAAAEEQMAFYLQRAFAHDSGVAVFNDLRFEDGDDAAQIDHLVLHLYGLFIIESKSICGEVTVNKHGEWARKWAGRLSGMPSPIQQGKRQAEFLRRLLNANREALRDKRLLGRLQGSFRRCPIDICVAISDRGIIRRTGANPPEVMKADQVCDRIRGEIDRHQKASGLLSKLDGDYGMWILNPGEFQRVCDFLLESHCPRQASPGRAVEVKQETPPVAKSPQVQAPVASDGIACKHCNSDKLVATYGKYGYYFKCSTCEKNTPIDYACRGCGKKGKIRKTGPRFDRVCAGCGREERLWSNEALAPG